MGFIGGKIMFVGKRGGRETFARITFTFVNRSKRLFRENKPFQLFHYVRWLNTFTISNT